MDPALLIELTTKNGADITALVAAMGGFEKALPQMPHVLNLLQTIAAYHARKTEN